MPGKPPCAPLAGTAGYPPSGLSASDIEEVGMTAISRTRGRGPRSLPWGIIYRTMGRTERIFPLRLILEISK